MEKNLPLDTIICGDCTQVLKDFPDNSIDLIFADPPYWVRSSKQLTRVGGADFDGGAEWDRVFQSEEEYEEFTRAWLTECRRVLKSTGSIWVMGGMQCVSVLGYWMQKLGFWTINHVIWQKTNPTPNFRGARLNNSHETIIWASKREKARFRFHYQTAKELNTDNVPLLEFEGGRRKQMGSVWQMPICAGAERLKDENGVRLHATQKPEELLYRILAISSSPGDVVLDPFGGSMTTAAVARRMGRHYISIERDERYCFYGRQRVEREQPWLGEIERAAWDQKPPRVTMLMLMDEMLLHTGEKVYLADGVTSGELFTDGRVRVGGELMDIHAAAALLSGGKAARVNGYEHLYVMRNGMFVSLGELRKRYAARLQKERQASEQNAR